jgi:hypothetical protein
MARGRFLVPYARPFPVWRRWEDPAGVFDWHADWYGNKRFTTEADAKAWVASHA